MDLGGERLGQPLPNAEECLGGGQVRGEALHRVSSRYSQGLSLRAITSKLDAEVIQTPRSGAWTATAVRRVLAHVQETVIYQEAA